MEGDRARRVVAGLGADHGRDRHGEGAGRASDPRPEPARITRVRATEEDTLFPEAGDMVEHFAFGNGEVLKSDGDRLHIRVGKEGKIREIALEMLKVTPLESEGDKRRFRLERRL